MRAPVALALALPSAPLCCPAFFGFWNSVPVWLCSSRNSTRRSSSEDLRKSMVSRAGQPVSVL